MKEFDTPSYDQTVTSQAGERFPHTRQAPQTPEQTRALLEARKLAIFPAAIQDYVSMGRAITAAEPEVQGQMRERRGVLLNHILGDPQLKGKLVEWATFQSSLSVAKPVPKKL